MKRVLVPLCLAASLAAQAPIADESAFVEVAASRASYFVHQPIRLRIRFGVEEQFLRTHIIQPFRRPLDVPVRLQAEWLQRLPGTVSLESRSREPSGPRPNLSFVLGASQALAPQIEDRQRDGRRFIVLEVERSYLPQEAGELQVSAPSLRFAYATRFREDIFRERVPEDRQEAVIQGNSLTLRIESLPEDGRPRMFAGAVGDFSVRAEANPRNPRVGDSIKLVLHIEGEGNLAFFASPRLDDLPGFHVFGKIEDFRPRHRVITYDLTPLNRGVQEVPAIPFAFFDPSPPGRYRTVAAPAIPLAVRPAAGGGSRPSPSPLTPRPPAAPRDIFDLKTTLPRDTARQLPMAVLMLGLAIPWLLAAGLLSWRWARTRRASAEDLRARGAAVLFRSRMARRESDVVTAFAEFLAARLRCSVPAVIAPNLVDRLVTAGIPGDLADRASVVLDELVATRYSGGISSSDATGAVETVEVLEAIFVALEVGR